MTTPYQQQAPAAPQAPVGHEAGYLSPIPVRRAHFGDALASEWTKLRSVRSTMWTLGVMIVLMLGIGVLAAVAVRATDSEEIDNSVLTLGFFGTLLGSICVITLGVLTIASEFGTGMIRTTLTACPSRVRVLAAKSLVFFLLVLVLTTVTAAVVGALQISVVGAPSPSGTQWLGATLGAGLYVAMLGLLSLAVGTLIRHSAGAVTIMIGVVLLPLVLAMFMFATPLDGLREGLFEYSIPNQLGTFYTDSAGTAGGRNASGWKPLLLLLGVTSAVMTGAALALGKRDV